MSDFKRADRVAGEVSAALSQVLLEGLRDPRVTPISITSVRMSDDLRVARVNFTPLGGVGDASTIRAGLEAAAGFLRREIGQRLRLKYTPELHFHPDESVGRAVALTARLEQMEAARKGRDDA